MTMYEEQKAVFEQNILRSELEMTPGGWGLEVNNGLLQSVGGTGCALSPSLIGTRASSQSYVDQLVSLYNVDQGWVIGAIYGFDERPKRDSRGTYQDGYAWGREMSKYIQGFQRDQA